MSDPFAPVDIGDLVQLSGGRVGIVERLEDETALVRLLFGERRTIDPIYVTANGTDPLILPYFRFGLTKIISQEPQDA